MKLEAIRVTIIIVFLRFHYLEQIYWQKFMNYFDGIFPEFMFDTLQENCGKKMIKAEVKIFNSSIFNNFFKTN